MYEELYENLPDKMAYLNRIGLAQAPPISKAGLDSLVLAHQLCVPFENLDVYEYQKPISLGIQDLFDKVVTHRRGGYCFELNGLFYKLLSELGYNAYCCPCRVMRDVGRGEPVRKAILHRGTIVQIEDDLLFCDVGYGGPMPPGALYIKPEIRQSLLGETFWFEKYQDNWFDLYRMTKDEQGNEKEERVLMICTLPFEPVDFVPLNEFCYKGENAPFRLKRMLNIRTKDGHLAIMNEEFTIVKNSMKTVQTMATNKELKAILKDYFGIDLTMS